MAHSCWAEISLSIWFRAIPVNIVSVEIRTKANVRRREHWTCNLISFGPLTNSGVIRVFCLLQRYPCVSAPFIISKPQFLDADESLVKNVDGLKPDRDEHDIFLHLEMVRVLDKAFRVIKFLLWNQISSTPLSAAKRLQFALDMEPVAKFDLMSKLPRAIVPLMWVEESAHLNTTYTRLFKGMYT